MTQKYQRGDLIKRMKGAQGVTEEIVRIISIEKTPLGSKEYYGVRSVYFGCNDPNCDGAWHPLPQRIITATEISKNWDKCTDEERTFFNI